MNLPGQDIWDNNQFIKEMLDESEFKNRAERNRIKREIQDDIKVMKSLTPNQIKFLNKVSDQKTATCARAMINETIMSYHTALYEAGLEYEQIIHLETRMREIIKESDDAIDKGEIDMDKRITRQMLVEKAKEHGLDKAGRIRIAKELKSTYSTVTTYISRWKITDKDLIDDEEKEENEAAEKILEIIDGNNPEKVIKAIEEVKEDIIMENKLEVLEEVRIMKVKGQNGEYEADSRKGVVLNLENSNIQFTSLEHLNAWAEEVRQVFNII